MCVRTETKAIGCNDLDSLNGFYSLLLCKVVLNVLMDDVQITELNSKNNTMLSKLLTVTECTRCIIK